MLSIMSSNGHRNVRNLPNANANANANPASEVVRYNFASPYSNMFSGQPTYTATLTSISTSSSVKPPVGTDNTNSLVCPENVANSTKYFTIPSITLVNKNIFSVTYWIKKNADTNGGDSVIWELDKNGGTALFQSNTTKQFKAWYGANYGFTLDTNWHHIATTFDYTNLQYSLYVDGIEVITNETTLLASMAPASTAFGTSRLARSKSTAHRSFNGYIGDFRIYNGTLTAAQVTSIYNGGHI